MYPDVYPGKYPDIAEQKTRERHCSTRKDDKSARNARLFTNTTKFGIGACFRQMSKLLAVKADHVGTLVGKVAKAITLPTSVLLSVVRETY